MGLLLRPRPDVTEGPSGYCLRVAEANLLPYGYVADDALATMPPYDFQKLVAGLLKAMGYHIAWDAPPGKDGGVDIIAWSDPLGTQTPRLKVQVKRQQATVAVDGLRAFLAVLGDGDVGLFVALGGFTRDAESEARLHQSRRLTLVDMRRFLELWIEHYPKLGDEVRQKLPLRPIYFLAPID